MASQSCIRNTDLMWQWIRILSRLDRFKIIRRKGLKMKQSIESREDYLEGIYKVTGCKGNLAEIY